MKYAVRLNLALNDWGFFCANSRTLGRHVIDGDAVGVTRRYVSKATSRRIIEMLPEDIGKACLGVNYSNITALPPHVHTREECVINLYADVAGQETVIYEGEINRLDGKTEDNGNGYFLVSVETLSAVESFRAEVGDVWLMNTKQPHAVLDDTGKCNRWLVQVFLSMPFNEAVGCASAAGLVGVGHVSQA